MSHPPIVHPSTLLKQLEGHARRRFGQNFLASEDIARRIVRTAGVSQGSKVLEIGPGLGMLTQCLLQAGAELVAIEIDRDLAAFQREHHPQVRLVEADATKVDFAELLDGDGWACVANLPYNVGTRLVADMVHLRGTFSRLVVMLQKEVAERCVAEPGDRPRGALSVHIQAHAAARIAMRVPPGAFHPRPKVDSAVLELVMRPEPLCGGLEPRTFQKFVRQGFSQPRKTLRNNIWPVVGKDAVDAVLAGVDIDPMRRPATLSHGEWVSLTRAMAAHLDPGPAG